MLKLKENINIEEKILNRIFDLYEVKKVIANKYNLKFKVIEDDYTIEFQFYGSMILPKDDEIKWRTMAYMNKHTKKIKFLVDTEFEIAMVIMNYFKKYKDERK